ncbi:MAG: hypothetical protein RDA78_06450 [Roseibium sp.]|uniref:hypothetical protein n=1 Tax=Roseibium sp. TaxID=1936156 RepID=UPI003D9C66C3
MTYFDDRGEHASYDGDMDDLGLSSRRFGDVDAIMDNLGDGFLDQIDHDFEDDDSNDFELYQDDDWSEYEADDAIDSLESDDPYNDVAI